MDNRSLSIRRRLFQRFAPPGSRRELIVIRLRNSYAKRGLFGTLLFAAELAALYITAPRGPFWVRQVTEVTSRVILYTHSDLFPAYPLRKSLAATRARHVPVSLITTFKNEKDSVEGWVASLMGQARLPDEVILVDGGSSDGTFERLQDLAARSPFSMTVLSAPGANIAKGRNIAIAHARHEVIACTDFGCRMRPDWLQNLVAPFEIDPQTQVVAGWYEVIRSNPKRMGMLSLPLALVDPQTFLPSSRSLAFTREAWKSANQYPEWLTLTGEDTLFAQELKRSCPHWGFTPEAVVEWQAPPDLPAYWRKVYGWATGDGEAGNDAWYYWRSFLRVIGASSLIFALAFLLLTLLIAGQISLWSWAILLILGGAGLLFLGFAGNLSSPRHLFFEFPTELARVSGFLHGSRSRQAAAVRRYQGLRRVFFILSGVPVDDTGGGARCTQLALELLRQGNAVVFINRFPKYESADLNLRISHPHLFTASLAEFRWEKFTQEYAPLLNGKPLAALVEFPLGDFLPLLNQIVGRGGVAIYDLVDAWDTALGSQWYSLEKEQQIIAASQVLVATEASLAERLERMSGRQVALLPNAVNARLFDPQRPYPLPADYPAADWSFIYIGALWGEWFDWDLLARCATRYPEAALVVVGDYRGQCANPPPNLHFLGLKAQRDLPAYLAQAQVAIIPWKVNPITQATSPLKLYEYLAMRKPVVTPDLLPLRGLPGVFATPDSESFIEKIGEVRQALLPEEEIARFIDQNNWQARVRDLQDLVDKASKPCEGSETFARFTSCP